MVNFNATKKWVILIPGEFTFARKAVEDLSRYIGLLARKSQAEQGFSPGVNEASTFKAPEILDAAFSGSSGPEIVLNCDIGGPERNGFSWRAGEDRIEIFGESGRGLCNGIYNFLAALGISWPVPGQEILPSPPGNKTIESSKEPVFTLACNNINEPSNYMGSNSAGAPWKRFVPAGKKEVNYLLRRSEAFAAWAARQGYDALVFPMAAFSAGSTGRKLMQLKTMADQYKIALEAGGYELTSLVPRSYFFLHRDFFRMEGGERKKNHHFCPTNPGAIRIIGKKCENLFRAMPYVKVFHLWPDTGAESVWCSCPTCRAFSPSEQNRIAVNAAADVLKVVNPGAYITFFERSEEEIKIPMRKNVIKMDVLPEMRYVK